MYLLKINNRVITKVDTIMTKLLAWLAYFFSRLLTLTLRVEYVNTENKSKAQQLSSNQKYIYALWHQNLLMALSSHAHQTCAMIVSSSKDGELVATACKHYGHYPVRGSSHRGAIRALAEMMKVIKSNQHFGAITVDGPKGPKYEVKKGIIDIAKKCQTPIVPLSFYPKSYWEFKSWDNFRLPKPFTKFIVVYGRPINVSAQIEKENYDKICQEIKNALFAGEQQAKNVFEV